jgi:hypothetical protein
MVAVDRRTPCLRDDVREAPEHRSIAFEQACGPPDRPGDLDRLADLFRTDLVAQPDAPCKVALTRAWNVSGNGPRTIDR